MLELGSGKSVLIDQDNEVVPGANPVRRSRVGLARAVRHEGGRVTKATTPKGGLEPDDTGDEMLTVGQAAALIGFGVNGRQVRRWVKAGRMAGSRERRDAWHRVPRSAAEAMRQELAADLAASQENQKLKAGERKQARQPDDS